MARSRAARSTYHIAARYKIADVRKIGRPPGSFASKKICNKTSAAADRFRGSPLDRRRCQKPSAKQASANHRHSGIRHDQTDSQTNARSGGIAPAPISSNRITDSQNADENPSCSVRRRIVPHRNGTHPKTQLHRGHPGRYRTNSKSSPIRQRRTTEEKESFTKSSFQKHGETEVSLFMINFYRTDLRSCRVLPLHRQCRSWS